MSKVSYSQSDNSPVPFSGYVEAHFYNPILLAFENPWGRWSEPCIYPRLRVGLSFDTPKLENCVLISFGLVCNAQNTLIDEKFEWNTT